MNFKLEIVLFYSKVVFLMLNIYILSMWMKQNDLKLEISLKMSSRFKNLIFGLL